MTKVLNNKTNKQRLCESCARRRAGEGWMQNLGGDINMLSSDALGEALQDLPLDEIVRSLFEQVEFTKNEPELMDEGVFDVGENMFNGPLHLGEFPADEDAVDEMEEAIEEEPDEGSTAFPWHTPRNIASARCSKCGTTWDLSLIHI